MRDITPIIFLTLNLKLMNVRMQQFHFIEKSIEIFSRLCRHCARYVTSYVGILYFFDPINHF